MKMLSLYQHRDTVIHRIDPLTKLYYIASVIIIPIIVTLKEVAAACLIASLLVLAVGKVIRKVIPIVSFSFILLLSIILIQSLFNRANATPILTLGPLTFYKEGLLYAADICLRVINILCAFSILVLTAKPSDLIEALVRRGLSPRLGYVLSSVLQIIPQMLSTMDTIKDAQRSRGMETEGKLLVRVKAFLPLLGPVVMNSLIATRERAMALDVRGFNSKTKRSFLTAEKSFKYSTLIKAVLLLLVFLAVIWRLLK